MTGAETASVGRPRSDAARLAVLHAVDDMLVDDGYAAMTMKGIAARAGVGKQTVYRWWNSKAEILLEAVHEDAREELAISPSDSTGAEFEDFREAVRRFLTESPAGAAYRALIGEAQHDSKVAELIRSSDVLVEAALPLLERAIERGDLADDIDKRDAADTLIGPLFFRILAGPVDRDGHGSEPKRR